MQPLAQWRICHSTGTVSSEPLDYERAPRGRNDRGHFQDAPDSAKIIPPKSLLVPKQQKLPRWWFCEQDQIKHLPPAIIPVDVKSRRKSFFF